MAAKKTGRGANGAAEAARKDLSRKDGQGGRGSAGWSLAGAGRPGALSAPAVMRIGFAALAFAALVGCFHYSPFDVGAVMALACVLGVWGASLILRAGMRAAGQDHIPFAAPAMAAFGLYFIATCVISQVPYYALTFAPIGLALPAVGAMVAAGGKAAAAEAGFFADAVLALFTPLAVWAIVQFFAYPELFAHTASHPLASANTLAAILNAVFILALGRFYVAFAAGKSPAAHGRRGIYALCVLLAGGGIIATGSSGALVTLMCVLPVFFGLGRMSGLVRLWPSLAFGAVLYAMFIIMNKVAQGQVSSLYHGTFHGRSYNERWLIWEAAIRQIAAHPWFGTGPGSFSAFYPPYRLQGDELSGLHAHNDLLHMAAGSGVIGAGLYVLVAGYVGWRCLKACLALKNPAADTEGGRAAARTGMMLATVFCAAGAIFVQGAVETVLISAAGSLLMGALAGLAAAMAMQAAGTEQGVLRLRPGTRAVTGGLAAVFAAFFAFVAIWPVGTPRHLAAAQGAMLRGDAAAFDAEIQTADRRAFGLSAGVYVMSAQWPLAAILGNEDVSPKDEALLQGRIAALFARALTLDPTMATVWAQRGELAAKKGQDGAAREMWRTALALDPGYLPARMSLARSVLEDGDRDGYIRIMLEGADIPYWRFAADEYYGKVLAILADGRDPAKAERVTEYLQNAEKNRTRTVRISGLLQGN